MATPDPSRNRWSTPLRVACALLGWALLVVGVGAVIHGLVPQPWAALGLASLLVTLPALLLVDRMLPADDARKGRGIATEVLPVIWLGLAVVLYGPLGAWLHTPLTTLAGEVEPTWLWRALAWLLTGGAS